MIFKILDKNDSLKGVFMNLKGDVELAIIRCS